MVRRLPPTLAAHRPPGGVLSPAHKREGLSHPTPPDTFATVSIRDTISHADAQTPCSLCADTPTPVPLAHWSLLPTPDALLSLTHTRRSAGCRRLTPAEPAHTHLGPWSRPEAGTARAAASELRPAGRRRRAAPASGKCSRLGDDGAAAPGLGPLTSQGPSGFGSGPRGTTHRPPPGSHCAHPKAFGDRLPDSECAGAASPGWAGLAEPDARGGDGAGRVLGG